MNLNKTDLRKIMYDFNLISNRLMQADYDDYSSILRKFLNFISSMEIIMDYVNDCGVCEFDLEKEFNEIENAFGDLRFTLGETSEEEVRNIFSYLTFVKENNIEIDKIARAYTNSNKYQDMVKGFNEKVVFVLIRHIDSYLTKIGIDMGFDENNTYNISVKNGQVNIANDNSSIKAYNNISLDLNKLEKLIQNINTLSKKENLNEDDEDQLSCYTEMISEEIKSNEPRKSFIRTALNGIKMIKGSAEFMAAITALVQFVQSYLN